MPNFIRFKVGVVSLILSRDAQLIFVLVPTVRITQDDYAVNEFERTVTICVERIGATTEPIDVVVTSRESSPASAVGKCEAFVRKVVMHLHEKHC